MCLPHSLKPCLVLAYKVIYSWAWAAKFCPVLSEAGVASLQVRRSRIDMQTRGREIPRSERRFSGFRFWLSIYQLQSLVSPSCNFFSWFLWDIYPFINAPFPLFCFEWLSVWGFDEIISLFPSSTPASFGWALTMSQNLFWWFRHIILFNTFTNIQR